MSYKLSNKELKAIKFLPEVEKIQNDWENWNEDPLSATEDNIFLNEELIKFYKNDMKMVELNLIRSNPNKNNKIKKFIYSFKY